MLSLSSKYTDVKLIIKEEVTNLRGSGGAGGEVAMVETQCSFIKFSKKKTLKNLY